MEIRAREVCIADEESGITTIVEIGIKGLCHLPAIFFDPLIKENMVVTFYKMGHPEVQLDNWYFSSFDGRIEIAGCIDGKTDMLIQLMPVNNG